MDIAPDPIPIDGRVEVTSHAGSRLVPLLRLPSLRIDDVALTDVGVLDVAKPAGDRAEGGCSPPGSSIGSTSRPRRDS